MSYFLKTITIFCGFLALLAPVHAQLLVDLPAEKEEFAVAPPSVSIKMTQDAPLDKSVLFRAEVSDFLLNQNINYRWDLGDGTVISGKQFETVEHSYNKIGNYTVRLEVDSGREKAISEQPILIYDKIILLLSDLPAEKEKIENLIKFAQGEDIYLKLIESFGASSRFLSEQSLVTKLKENLEAVSHADTFIVWTGSSEGMNALTRLLFSPSAAQINFADKQVVQITEDALTTLSRIAQEGTFAQKRFGQIVITRKDSLRPLLTSSDSLAFSRELENRLIDFKIVDQQTSRLRWNNFLLYFVNYMRASGISSEIIMLILMIPAITAFIAFVKQVIGISTFGVYLPTIVTLFFLTIGLRLGLPILFLILLSGFLTRFALRKVRMLYTPRMAVVLSISSITIFFILVGGIYFELFDAEFVKISIFPLLVMSTLAERFVSLQGDAGYRAAVIAMSEMLGVALIGYFLVGRWTFFQNLLLGYPEITLLFILASLLMGRWTGLRLLEYIRFREIIKHAEE